MKLKDVSVQVKAGPDAGLSEGQFTAYASVFGNRDSYGDVVMPGAFDKTLKEWGDSGHPIPLLFGHNMSDPDFNIGHVVSAVEDERGLKVTAELDLENPKALQTYRMLKGGRVNQMSFAYDVIDGGAETVAGEEVFALRELKVYEVSVVTIGANQETEVLAVKAAAEALVSDVKAGRVLAQKHIDSLRAAQEAIGAVVTAAEGDQEKEAQPASPVKDEEPEAAKSEEPSPTSPADHYLTVISIAERN